MGQQKERKIGYYLLGKTIGQGTFGKVKLATHTLTGQHVAIKILMKQKIVDVADVERVSRQIHILKLIRHPSIIQLYQIIETSKHLFLVMEYVEKGELFEYIVKKQTIEEEQACRYFKYMISGIAYLHKLNIVHRDLKPQNLLIDWKNTLKIVDFGLSNTYKIGEMLKTACGSPCYAAPEMIASKKYNGLEVDLWSCGVILFASVCGYLPFQDSNTPQLYKKILSGSYNLPKFVSIQFKDLLQKILNVNPSKRYRIQQIYAHPWCQQVKDIPLNSGIIVGYHRIPVDKEIITKMSEFNFDLQYAQRCIQANKHNHITTTYYLLLKKLLKVGYKSNADLSNPNFDYNAVQPFRRIDVEKKYHFFGMDQQTPMINIENKDIKLINKNNKAYQKIDKFKPQTSKHVDQKKVTINNNENRRSNNFFHKKQAQQLNQSKKFHDLRMYLKVPKKKQYYSQAKKKQERKNHVHSVYYDPKQNKNIQQPMIIKLQTQHSQDKSYKMISKVKQQKYKIMNRIAKISREKM